MRVHAQRCTVPRLAPVVVAVALAAALAGCGSGAVGTARDHPASIAGEHPTSSADAPSCPSAPFRGWATGRGETLRPPASRDVAHGRFVRPLVLDGGGLAVDPPRPDDAAAYSGDDAVCEVLASTLSNNGPVPPQSRHTIAVGLARATVADRLLHGQSNLDQAQSFGTVDGVADVNPKRPAPSAYHDRLAWVAVVQDQAISSCPAMTAGQSPPSYDEPGHHGYAVFLVDASTGGDALLYTERRNGICPGSKPDGPWVDVPLTSVSVPWQLVSEQPDRSSAQISFTVTPCDGYSGVILADEDSNPALVRVVVQRPFGPACGAVRRVVEKMRAARLRTDLPPKLRHAAVGPYVE